jgi:hypothetical protein
LPGGDFGTVSAQRALTRLDCSARPWFDGYTAVTKRIASEHQPKIVARRRGIGYSVTVGAAKTEIPDYFRLTVRDAHAFDRDDVVVSVEDGELFIKRFVATPSYLSEPGVATLLWEVVGADRVEIDKITSPLDNAGSSTVHVNTSEEFTLTAWRGEKSISETLAVTVACPVPVIELFSANPQQVAEGGSTL